MYNCKKCKKKTVGVMIQSPETNEPEYLPDICSKCLNALSEKVNKANKAKPTYTCKICEARVWSLRNGECWDCHEAAVEAVEELPDYVEPLQPPMGYNIIGLNDIMAEMEVAAAYAETPVEGELEN